MTATADATNDSTVVQLVQIVSDLQDTVETQADQIARQADRIDALETELDNQRQNIRGAFTKLGAIDDRLDDLETEVEQQTNEDRNGNRDGSGANRDGSGENRNGCTDDRNGPDQTRTPLETICALPEHLATRELSANQERARFIAADVRDYAEKAPAGLVIDSRAIKRVLTAKEGERPHTQTIARVMDFLDRLGKDTVEQHNRRGRKLVAVDPDAARRMAANHTRCDREKEGAPTESVIS